MVLSVRYQSFPFATTLMGILAVQPGQIGILVLVTFCLGGRGIAVENAIQIICCHYGLNVTSSLARFCHLRGK